MSFCDIYLERTSSANAQAIVLYGEFENYAFGLSKMG